MSDLIKRATAAAWDELHRQHDGSGLWCKDEMIDGSPEMEEVVKAIIKAMRVPEEGDDYPLDELNDAGLKAHPDPWARAVVPEQWNAMIDALLSE